MKPTSTLTYTRFRSLGHVLLAALAAASLPTAGIAQAPGTLDANFDTDGVAVFNYPGSAQAEVIAIEPGSNKIILAGSHLEAAGTYFNFTRLNPDGSPDVTFDGNGQLFVDVEPNGGAYCLAVKCLSDGKILGVGIADLSFQYRIALVRRLPDGAADATFGTNGIVITNVEVSFGARISVAVLPDGKYIVVSADNNNLSDFVVLRFNSNGTLDNTFSYDGKVSIDFSGSTDVPVGVAIQTDGKIVVGGTSSFGGIDYFAIARLNPDGTLDNSFDSDGRMRSTLSMTGDNHYGSGLVLLENGRIILVGTVEGAPYRSIGMIKVLADGSMDQTFGNSGQVRTPLTPCETWTSGAMDQGDGSIVVVGRRLCSGSDCAVLIARFNIDGTLDNTFGVDGFVETNIDIGSCDYGNSVTKQTIGQDTFFVVGGYTDDPMNGLESDMFAARYWTGLQVGVAEFTENQVSARVHLNPIQPTTILSYTLAEAEELTIALHDLQGRVLTTYLNGKDMPAGEHTQTITMPEGMAAGNYLLVLSSPKGKMSIQVTKGD